MSDLDRQIDAYKRQEAELKKLHVGKAVVFAEEQLQGIYDDIGVATHDAIKRFEPGKFMVRIVGEDTLPAKYFLRVG